MVTTGEEKAQNYITKLEKENEIMKKLSTSIGFYESYFEELKNYVSKELAFEKVNNLYLELFGVKRYDNFLQFCGMIRN
ncbi:hypothetical protein [Flavobacterium sp. M31R6]|uniref:hypothetical protein n=1 Tax=Flavobacterium sp. M31R6 TaxID=2739062 RepID=UPI0015688EAE|nr:hypothetical protein [Flavobacterium sp. M31R6]QKJ62304.1 hypothetical protein HQN62_03850 [Flavobacterium sp. M31R6]